MDFKKKKGAYIELRNGLEKETVADKDIAAELKKYNELLKEGIITQDEFDAKKKQLLEL